MRWVKRLFVAIVALAFLLWLGLVALRAYVNVDCRRTEVIYGRSFGTTLTLDVFQPRRPNGAGVIVLISGRWKSSHDSIDARLYAPFLRRGYTMFAVVHGAQPKYTVSEIFEQVQRAVRFIRQRAADYGVDPGRLGVIGGSSGGHLCLLLATRGSAGDPAAADPVDRESSALQAVACFYPVTDLLNLGSSTENPGDGGPPINFREAFGPRAQKLEDWRVLGRELSPIFHVSSNTPPTLIIHGGADTLVPLDQSERYAKAAQQVNALVEVQVRPGKKHGWPTMVFDLFRMASWFDRYLAAPAK